MFVVIFEVRPHKERWDEYLAIAGSLRPEIEKIDGFIENERFASQSRPGLVLSLSTWRDEKAVIRWRTLGQHHQAQEKGRSEIFADYHLWVGEVVADSAVPEGRSLRQQRFDETEIGAAKIVTLSELTLAGDAAPEAGGLAEQLGLPAAGTGGVVAHEAFGGIYAPAKRLLLASWDDEAAALGWRPDGPAVGGARHRTVRVIRDYGLRDRREAPQYYPDIAGASDRS